MVLNAEGSLVFGGLRRGKVEEKDFQGLRSSSTAVLVALCCRVLYVFLSFVLNLVVERKSESQLAQVNM